MTDPADIELDPDTQMPPDAPTNAPLTGEEQIRIRQLELEAETNRDDNENKFKLARTEARVKASIAITAGAIAIAVIVALVVLTLSDKKAPDSIGPILPMLIGLMSGVASVALTQRSSK